MGNPRQITIVIGILIGVSGLGLLLFPELTENLTTNDIVVVVVGLLALVQGVRMGGQRVSKQTLSTPVPELRNGTDMPGRTFDADLWNLDPGVRNRVESTAQECLIQYEDESPERARQRLEEGDWTDDLKAAAFFSGDIASDESRIPRLFGGQPQAVRQARAAVSSLSDLVQDHVPKTELSSDYQPKDALYQGSGLEEQKDNVETSGPATHKTGHWAGVGTLTLITIAVAVFTKQPALLAVSAVGVAIAAYGSSARAGTFTEWTLAIERTLDSERPARGDAVTVRVTIRNEGDSTIPDLRIIDGVPGSLVVTGGSPRHAVVLLPGQETTFFYTVEAEYGEHTFGPAFVVTYDLSGERRRVSSIDGQDTSLLCRPPAEIAEGVPIGDLTTNYAGQLNSNEGGSGLQFHDTRQYQPGDPISLIDWKSLARTGELTSVSFQEERMAEIMLVIDARRKAALAPAPTERSAISRSVEAADVLLLTLLETNNRVGITALSPERCWLAPGRGNDHRIRARELLMTHSAFDIPVSNRPYVASSELSRLSEMLSPKAQVIILSPLCDDSIRRFIERLRASGIETTVISPDPIRGSTAGEQLAQIERLLQLTELRRMQIPVYDWQPDEPLPLALRRIQGVT